MAVLPSTSRLPAISVNIIHPETAVAGRGAETSLPHCGTFWGYLTAVAGTGCNSALIIANIAIQSISKVI